MKQKELSDTPGGNAEGCSLRGKQSAADTQLACDPALPLLGVRWHSAWSVDEGTEAQVSGLARGHTAGTWQHWVEGPGVLGL